MEHDIIYKASQLLQKYIYPTPLEYNERLSKKYRCRIFLKREDLHEIKSFKIRGALYKILTTATKNIVTASTGNHAQGVAYSCALLKIKGYIYVPTTIPKQKEERILFFGGQWCDIIKVGSTFEEALEAATEYATQNDMTFIHPFNDMDVIYGQGTICKEIYDAICPDYIISGIGGGGMISGILIYSKHFNKSTKVIGVECTNKAMNYALKNNYRISSIPTPVLKINTFVDGAAVTCVGNITMDICASKLDDLYSVEDKQIKQEMLDLYNIDKIVVEPAGALSVSVLDIIKDKIIGKKVVCVISGGNYCESKYKDIF